MVNHGHNDSLGWSFTSNSPDLIDVYELEMNPLNENEYLFDGSWKKLEVEETKIKVVLSFIIYGTAVRYSTQYHMYRMI